ncbi:hypothetical protein [Halorussus sp. AFM4]|uniref:hypothetical protein n=1 Tax=Halorussus sp. AFM4 TaxID=3421651 RepID=UPI003EBDE0D2
MTHAEEIEISEVRLLPEFTQYDPREGIVWVPDAIKLKIRRQCSSGETVESLHSYTCLEHVLLLLDQLEEGTSDTVLWGSSGLGVEFTGSSVTLSHKGVNLVGSRTSIRQAVEDLIQEIFEELRRQGVDTDEVARQLQEGRFASRTIEPLDIHDRLID